MGIIKFRLICFSLCFLSIVRKAKEKQTRNPELDYSPWACHSFRLPRPSTQIIRPSSMCWCQEQHMKSARLRAWMDSASSLRVMVICEISPLTKFAHLRLTQKNLSIYFVVSTWYATFASVELRKLGKMFLVGPFAKTPFYQLTPPSILAWETPTTPLWRVAPSPAKASPPPRQRCCRRLIN